MRTFTLGDFDYALPRELIALLLAFVRCGVRLLDATREEAMDRVFRLLPQLLAPGDLMVFNDTQVIKARLFGEKPTGGKVELLVERVTGEREVVAHMKVSKKPPAGTVLAMDGGFTARLEGRWHDENGALFRFTFSDGPHA